MQGKSIGQHMAASGYTNGFDYLRVILALAVVLGHSIVASGDPVATAIALGPVFGPFQASILTMFFALSGFLVAGSLDRCRTLEGFATLRVLRIVPALAVEVLLSALILGPVMTELSLSEYFSSRSFYSYFLNIVGSIHFVLPGVFQNNPHPYIVNNSLWTIPYELECYIALIVMAALTLFRRPKWFLAGSVLILLVVAVSIYAAGDREALEGHLPGRLLVVAFLAGVTLYLFRNVIPRSGALALACAVVAFVLMSIPYAKPFSVIPVGYLTVWLGLLNPRKIPLLFSGDYSYGLYLFAFPIQQVVASVPALASWYTIFLIAAPAGLLYAAFSWHFVEKPVLERRKSAVAFVEGVGSTIRLKLSRLRRGGPREAASGQTGT
ncbi:MAG: acyltransferase [Bosea sp.]|nr:acyltransferase [Bosea sp. (in: a-proteobacteria)]